MKQDYITALLWSSYHYENGDDIPFDEIDTELSKELDDKITSECSAFYERAEKLLARYWNQENKNSTMWDYNHPTDQQIGHDFALTRNGHGAGFWDRPEIYGERCADLLTTLSNRYGESNIYLGDDGLIYD